MSCITVKRVFHPIGQGAFYTEQIGEFNFVYDCGEWKQSNKAKRVISQALPPNTQIDILFISHFDFDHISLIPTLKEKYNIKNVILPLLHENEKNILINFNRVNKQDLITLIKSPTTFFGKDTKIIYVESPIMTKNTESSDDGMELKISDIASEKIIKSGTKIIFSNTRKTILEWVMIPYNIEDKSRSQFLESKLKDNGFDIEKLKNDIKHFLNLNKEDIKKIKKIYNELDGKINQNSMFLYSGPQKNTACHFTFFNNNRQPPDVPQGCIYTGDGDLNISKIEDIYKKYSEFVATIQIPHHGSNKNFSDSFFDHFDHANFFPVSFATNNTYGHPSYHVISHLQSKRRYTLKVTECMDSGFCQYFEFSV